MNLYYKVIEKIKRIGSNRRMGLLMAYPNPVSINSEYGITTLSWTSIGTEEVEIRVNAPDGPLFSHTKHTSSATAIWGSNGMLFYLQDVTGGMPLIPSNTLSTVTIKLINPEDPTTGIMSNRISDSELERLCNMPRYTPTKTLLCGKEIDIVDAKSFLQTYYEIFLREIYYFHSNSKTPFIIDGGANIGLSILFFKTLYPKSRIIAFEPDAQIFVTLVKNINTWEFEDITLIEKALWNSETVLKFRQDGGDAGHIERFSDLETSIQVQATGLRKYITESVDFLKLDIEGAETEVIRDCEDLLKNVCHIFIEYHSFLNERQNLHELLSILLRTGFKFDIDSRNGFVSRPFLNHNHIFDSGMQHIFAFKT